MQFKFSETEHGFYLNLTPETPEECGQVLRLANMAALTRVRVATNFSGKQPDSYIFISKSKSNNVNNSVSKSNW